MSLALIETARTTDDEQSNTIIPVSTNVPDMIKPELEEQVINRNELLRFTYLKNCFNICALLFYLLSLKLSK